MKLFSSYPCSCQITLSSSFFVITNKMMNLFTQVLCRQPISTHTSTGGGNQHMKDVNRAMHAITNLSCDMLTSNANTQYRLNREKYDICAHLNREKYARKCHAGSITCMLTPVVVNYGIRRITPTMLMELLHFH